MSMNFTKYAAKRHNDGKKADKLSFTQDASDLILEESCESLVPVSIGLETMSIILETFVDTPNVIYKQTLSLFPLIWV